MAGELSELVAISRKYGSNPDYVLAGGGNTSVKNAGTLHVKASGTALATITESGFVAIDREKLDRIWHKTYAENPHEREKAVLADLLAARKEHTEARPSVETLMHGLFPERFVVHTHPCLVNGVTCARDGEAAAHRLLGDLAVWVPLVDPGYILAKTVKDMMNTAREADGRSVRAVLMQNHGLVVSGDSEAQIDATTQEIMSRIGAAASRRPDFSPVPSDIGAVERYVASLRSLARVVVFVTNTEVARLVGSRQAMSTVASAFSPDHIVYAGREPLFAASPEELAAAWSERVRREGTRPRIVAAQGLGVFACADSMAGAERARDLFLDAVKVSVYTESFGGPLFLPRRMINFISAWEAESYRARVSAGEKPEG